MILLANLYRYPYEPANPLKYQHSSGLTVWMQSWDFSCVKENSKQMAFHGAAFQCNHKYHYILGPVVSVSHTSITKTPLDVLPYQLYQ